MSVQSIDPNTAAAPIWRFPGGLVGLACAVGGLSLWLFWDKLRVMASWWWGAPE